MNPPENPPDIDTPPPSRNYTWLWVLLALFTLTSASVILVGIKMLRKSGGTAPGEALAQSAGGITPIDLTAFYDKSGSWNTGSEWQQAPRGSIALGGVPFEMNGLLRLSGRSAKNDGKGYREEVNGIPVNRKFERLHVLHIVSYNTSQEGPYARITLRHTDGSTSVIPMIYGQHGRDWHRPRYEHPSALEDPNSKVVWRGDYTGGRTLRIFKTTFPNPKPNLEVTAIDLASEMASPNATFLAMSTGPVHLPAPKDDPPSLPEPEEIYDGAIQFTAVDADNKPVPDVQLKISGTEQAGSFRTPPAVTDAKGECVIKHPGDATRTLTVVASGDGIAVKTIRWGQRDGDIIPVKYKFLTEKADRIGGLIQDETRQPVLNAKITISALGTPNDPTSYNQLPLAPVTLTNDAQGRWEFRSLPKGFGSIHVVVSHPDYLEARYLGDGVDRAYSGDRVAMATLLKSEGVFNLRKGLILTGRVMNEQGEPISGARLLLGESRYVNNASQARTDGRGEFRLAATGPGATFVTVQASGRSPDSRSVNVTPKMEPLEFKLKPGHVIKARVVDENGKPVRTARITIDTWQSLRTLDLTGSTDAGGLVSINSAPEGGMVGSIYKAGYMSTGGIQFVADDQEHDYTLRKSATLTGTVVDAETKQPIDRFEVTRGQSYGNGNDQISWHTYNITKGANGAFSLKLDQQGMNMILIEADEHQSAIVSLATNTGTHFEIELKKGSGPKGIVLTPDGLPAAKAYVGVLVRGRSLVLAYDKLTTYSDSESKPVVANAEGAFTLRSAVYGEKIVATHQKGFAEMDFSNFVNGSSIKLQPWGSINGQLKMGTRPGTNESVLLSSDGGMQYNYQDYKVTTDDQGRFTMTNVPPGDRLLVRLVSVGPNSWGHSHRQPITVKTGEVTLVTMGGNGRTVVGKVALSDSSRSLDFRQSGHHALSYYPRPPQTGITDFRAWNNLPSTIEARRNSRSYTLSMQQDGSFRIDDVLAATYDLRIQLSEGNDGRGVQNYIGSLSTNVVVPDIENPVGAPPLDLGTIVVPLTGNARPNALLR